MLNSPSPPDTPAEGKSLAEWMAENGISDAEMARRTSEVSGRNWSRTSILRARSGKPSLSYELIDAIRVVTGGIVQPNSFFPPNGTETASQGGEAQRPFSSSCPSPSMADGQSGGATKPQGALL